jgi:hypothetical protein
MPSRSAIWPAAIPSVALRRQQADQVKPRLMRKGREGGEGFTSVHRSTIQETLN